VRELVVWQFQTGAILGSSDRIDRFMLKKQHCIGNFPGDSLIYELILERESLVVLDPPQPAKIYLSHGQW
jgi:hypothetical protein